MIFYLLWWTQTAEAIGRMTYFLLITVVCRLFALFFWRLLWIIFCKPGVSAADVGIPLISFPTFIRVDHNLGPYLSISNVTFWTKMFFKDPSFTMSSRKYSQLLVPVGSGEICTTTVLLFNPDAVCFCSNLPSTVPSLSVMTTQQVEYIQGIFVHLLLLAYFSRTGTHHWLHLQLLHTNKSIKT